mmetsp:Transcript_28670/g.34924  ORF Transcript_28670/g.34924 Transcript_28670/m.34924 type:complete len:230 (+) Transcript_28670:11-700(+)
MFSYAFMIVAFNILIGEITALKNTPISTVTSKPDAVNPLRHSDYKLLSDKIVYSRWRSVIQRTIQLPSGEAVNFDIIDQRGTGAVLIFAWNSRTKTATLLREYNPAPCKILYGPAAGLIESKHGSDPLVAARHELEEELHLKGGTWYPLNKKTVPMDKYVVTEINAYLVLDAEEVLDPRERDAEEFIEIVKDLTVDDIKDLIVNGEMNLVGGWGCLMALEKLRELGEIE